MARVGSVGPQVAEMTKCMVPLLLRALVSRPAWRASDRVHATKPRGVPHCLVARVERQRKPEVSLFKGGPGFRDAQSGRQASIRRPSLSGAGAQPGYAPLLIAARPP